MTRFDAGVLGGLPGVLIRELIPIAILVFHLKLDNHTAVFDVWDTSRLFWMFLHIRGAEPDPEVVQNSFLEFLFGDVVPTLVSSLLCVSGANAADSIKKRVQLVQFTLDGRALLYLDFVQKLDTWRNRRTSCCGWPTEILYCRG